MCRGNFEPWSFTDARLFGIRERDRKAYVDAIMNSRYKMICLNDGDGTRTADFEKEKAVLNKVFSRKYPEKSSFEK